MMTCTDCDKTIKKSSTRCKSCARKFEWGNGSRVYNSYGPRGVSTVRQLTEVEAAWLGALIEGEGHIAAHTDHRGYCQPRVVVEMVPVEPIATVLRLVGDGNISMAKQREPYQDSWRWELKKMRSLQEFLPQIMPYLASKREVAEEVLKVVS